MKTIIITTIASILFIASVQAQTIPVDTAAKKVVYTDVIKLDGVSKAELYTRARAWFAKTYNSAKSVLQMDDKDAGKLIGNAAEPLSFRYALVPLEFDLKYNIEVDVKDGRYRYTITDITVPDRQASGYHLTIDEIVVDGKTKLEKTKKDNGEYRNRFKGYVIESDKYIRALVDSLKSAMSVKSKDDF